MSKLNIEVRLFRKRICSVKTVNQPRGIVFHVRPLVFFVAFCSHPRKNFISSLQCYRVLEIGGTSGMCSSPENCLILLRTRLQLCGEWVFLLKNGALFVGTRNRRETTEVKHPWKFVPSNLSFLPTPLNVWVVCVNSFNLLKTKTQPKTFWGVLLHG